MKKILISAILGLLGVLILPANLAVANESPWGILINNDLEQCADLWNGEEYAKYAYEDGWEIYYPQPNTEGVFQIILNDETSCDYGNGNQDCCQAIGYTFVEDTDDLLIEAPELYIDDNEDVDDVTDVDDVDENDTEESIDVVDFLMNNIYIVGIIALVLIAGVVAIVFVMKRSSNSKTASDSESAANQVNPEK